MLSAGQLARMMRQRAKRALLVIHKADEKYNLDFSTSEPTHMFEAGEGIETWLHEVCHYVLLFGSLETRVENSRPDSDVIGMEIGRRDEQANDWGAIHEINTLATEFVSARCLGWPISHDDVIRFAIDNENVGRSWTEPLRLKKEICRRTRHASIRNASSIVLQELTIHG